MKLWAIFLLLSVVLATGHRLLAAQDDYLTEGEVEAVRDTGQEPEKRLTVYLTFAQRRLDTVRSALTSEKPGSGEAVQRNLSEYNHILQAMEDTIDDARANREPLGKSLQQITTRTKEFLKYLETIQPSASASKDYQFALEEALAMTHEELDVVGKGEYPEVKQRKPPSDLPASPPPPPPQNKSGSDDQGPPRKSSNQH